MEFGSDQCNKEGCKGCYKCQDSSFDYGDRKPIKNLADFSEEALEKELATRKLRSKNAAMLKKLQGELNNLRKQIYKIEQKMKEYGG